MPLKLQLGLYAFFPRTTRVCDEITLLRVIHLNQIGIKSFKQTPTKHPQQPQIRYFPNDTKWTKFNTKKKLTHANHIDLYNFSHYSSVINFRSLPLHLYFSRTSLKVYSYPSFSSKKAVKKMVRVTAFRHYIHKFYRYWIFTCNFLLSSSLSLRDFSRNDSNSTSFSCKNELLLRRYRNW